MKKNIPYKYRIHYFLHKLGVHDYEIAMDFLPIQCGVTKESFKKWIYIKADESRCIPAEAIQVMATFFEVPSRVLFENAITKEDLGNRYKLFRNEKFPQNVYSSKFL